MKRIFILVASFLHSQIGFSQAATVSAGGSDTDAVAAYSYSPPPSAWRTQEKQRAIQALSLRNIDVLVAPFQVDGHAIDAAGRSLMTMSLSQAIKSATQYKVADPGLVEKAFGSGSRVLTKDDIQGVSEIVGANVVILGFVGHNREGSMDLRIEKLSASSGTPNWASKEIIATYEGITFDDAELPYYRFLELQGDVINSIFEDSEKQKLKKPTLDRASLDLPENFETFSDAIKNSPIRVAYYYQFLGALHPVNWDSRARDRLFERSIIIAERLPENSLDRPILIARAFAWLNRRPAALQQLGDSQVAEASALRAYLNGNTVELENALSDIESPLLRIISWLELEQLKSAYGQSLDTDAAQNVLTVYPDWALAFYQYFQTRNPWSGHSPTIVKLGLDSQFPIAKFDLETEVAARLVIDEVPDEFEITELAFNHIEASDKENQSAEFSLSKQIMLDFWREHLVASTTFRIKHLDDRIGEPSSAVTAAKLYESLLAGHGGYTLALGFAQWGASSQKPGSAKQNLEESAYENLRRGALWQLGQSENSKMVLTGSHQFFPGSRALSDSDDAKMFFASDWPSLPDWGWMSLRGNKRRIEILRHCVGYTKTNLQCVLELHASLTIGKTGNPKEAQLLIDDMDRRFVGHPRRVSFLASLQREQGNDAASNEVLSQAVDAASLEWAPYQQLAQSLARQGRAEEALQIALRYPGFTDPDASNRVALSNYAYDIGSLLYWAGVYESARPLYELAAGYQTNSHAGMASAVRLDLMRKNYEGATEGTVLRVRRYRAAFATRDLMELLTLQGDFESARMILDGSTSKLAKPELWDGALTLHRATATSQEDMIAWAYGDGRGEIADPRGLLADRFIFMSKVIDRKPTADLHMFLSSRLEGSDTSSSMSSAEKDPRYLPQRRVDLSLAARGITAFHANDFDEAQHALEPIVYKKPMNEFLPYYARAATKTGATTKLAEILNQLEAREKKLDLSIPGNIGYFFDLYLSKAFVYGANDEHEKALSFLALANRDVRYTDNRALFTRYQILEAAEFLYQDSGINSYRLFALDLARRNTIIEPTSSWAHAFLAKLTDDDTERNIAAARALFLDPGSFRMSQLGDDVIRLAKGRAENGFPKPDDEI